MADQQAQGKPAEPVVAPAAGAQGGRREGESQHAVDPMSNDPLTVGWGGAAGQRSGQVSGEKSLGSWQQLRAAPSNQSACPACAAWSQPAPAWPNPSHAPPILHSCIRAAPQGLWAGDEGGGDRGRDAPYARWHQGIGVRQEVKRRLPGGCTCRPSTGSMDAAVREVVVVRGQLQRSAVMQVVELVEGGWALTAVEHSCCQQRRARCPQLKPQAAEQPPTCCRPFASTLLC